MITLTILIKESPKNALVMSFDPVLDNATELEETAGKIFAQELWKAYGKIQGASDNSMDIQGDPAREYQRRIFGK